MTIHEVAALLTCTTDIVRALIGNGIRLVSSGKIIKLGAMKARNKVHISDRQFDRFVSRAYADDPSRSVPAAVRRELLKETRNHCAICVKQLPLQFHHILEWGRCLTIILSTCLLSVEPATIFCSNGQIDQRCRSFTKEASLTRVTLSPQTMRVKSLNVKRIWYDR